MTQAVNGLTPPCATEQVCNAETLHRLRSLSALASFLTHGCLDLGGPELQDALGFVAEELADCVDQLEQRAWKLAQAERRRLTTHVEEIINAYWTGLGAYEDCKAIQDNPWPRRAAPHLHVAWVAGWRQGEWQF